MTEQPFDPTEPRELQPHPTAAGAPVGPYGPPGPVAGAGQPVTVVVLPKSPGVAAVLTIVWMGAGQLYAGRHVGIGVMFMLWNLVLSLLSFTVLLTFFTIPLWFVTMPIALVLALNDVKAQNARLGVVTA